MLGLRRVVLLSQLLLAGLGAAALVGCGQSFLGIGGSSGSDSEPEPPPGDEPPPTPDPDPIPAPGSNLRLAWNPVTTDVGGNPLQIAGYLVYAAESGSPYREVGTTVVPSVELVDLSPETVYVIAVKAIDLQDVKSEFSEPITVLMP